MFRVLSFKKTDSKKRSLCSNVLYISYEHCRSIFHDSTNVHNLRQKIEVLEPTSISIYLRNGHAVCRKATYLIVAFEHGFFCV